LGVARKNDYTIVTFDEDFEALEALNGFPPKVILFRFGNAPTNLIEKILRQKLPEIQDFLSDDSTGLLEIY
jgi:predicted nuclease of predicted toxin-antitoxin system